MLPFIAALLPYRNIIMIGVLLASLGGAYFYAYERGKHAERAAWQERVSKAQARVAEVEQAAAAQTAKTKDDYERKLKDINTRLGAMVDVNTSLARRLRNTTRTDPVVVSAPTCSAAGAAPAVDPAADAVARENQRRYEVNALRLQELQTWVTQQIKLHESR